MDSYRFLGPHREVAHSLYERVASLPLVCPHGHVDPAMLADPDAEFPNPVELFIRPDHYILRMLYSQGLELAYFLDKDVPPRDVWRTFCGHFHLFWGTPSGLRLRYQLSRIFSVKEPIDRFNADLIYDQLTAHLLHPAFRPRALFERYQIEVLCTTDAATDTLEHHAAIASSGWDGRVLPTFRPDKLLAFSDPHWPEELARLQNLVSVNVTTWSGFLDGLAERRQFFKSLGCVATDHSCEFPYTEILYRQQAEEFFDRALRGRLPGDEARRLQGHLLIKMAEMSCEDGLVMQLHSGSHRNHNEQLLAEFGPDRGADIPVAVNFTQDLKPLLNRFGSHPHFRLLVFTLDESTYSRELAPLAGHYPALRLGPPWWFHDSLNGMLRYFDCVMETAGVYNTAGFNDGTRAFCSIPARHDLWRRVSCRWLAGLLSDGVLTETQAHTLATELAVGRARDCYRLGG